MVAMGGGGSLSAYVCVISLCGSAATIDNMVKTIN
jgi:hypothetical protein